MNYEIKIMRIFLKSQYARPPILSWRNMLCNAHRRHVEKMPAIISAGNALSVILTASFNLHAHQASKFRAAGMKSCFKHRPGQAGKREPRSRRLLSCLEAGKRARWKYSKEMANSIWPYKYILIVIWSENSLIKKSSEISALEASRHHIRRPRKHFLYL